METITWDRFKLARFKKAYQQATEDKNEIFTFDGHQFVIGYAKYLIQYLEDQFK